MYYKRTLFIFFALSFGILLVSGIWLGFIVKAEENQKSLSVLEKKRVEVIADNHNITIETYAGTVGELLEQLDIRVEGHDIVEPSKDTKLKELMQIRVTRVSVFEEEEYEDIPYVTVTYEDPDLVVGNEMVIQEGKPGKVIVRRSYRVENGRTVATEVINRQVIVPYTPKVVAVGMAEPEPIIETDEPGLSGEQDENPLYKSPAGKPKVVTIEARPVRYIYKMDNVQLTAYTAGAESTGKNPGDPGYGITATGTRATEGITIAVDPEVIPLGWWVYIPGVGYRRAEDTGSAVKGKIIDVYIEDLSKAKKFGRKHGNTVYVIGPEKPR